LERRTVGLVPRAPSPRCSWPRAYTHLLPGFQEQAAAKLEDLCAVTAPIGHRFCVGNPLPETRKAANPCGS